MVTVKGRSDSAIAAVSQLGLADSPITITPTFKFKDVNVDAWGMAPAEVQWMLAEAAISMRLINFDRAVLDACVALSMGGGQPSVGQMARAGTLMGGNVPLFSPGNNYITLNILSPVDGKPWRFFTSYLAERPMEYPLGTEKSIVQLTWRAIPWTLDPWNGGLGATNVALWDNTVQT
jgi:hypothetical protein